MYEIERRPGPCAMCGVCFMVLRQIPGECGDGICEGCDAAKWRILHPRKRFVPWQEILAVEDRKRQVALPAEQVRPVMTVSNSIKAVSAERRAASAALAM